MWEAIKKFFRNSNLSKGDIPNPYEGINNPSSKNIRSLSKDKLQPPLPNYNDQLDGYGAGEAESNDLVTHKKKNRYPEGISDLGIPNQYGEVDQYSFRDPGRIPLRKRKKDDEANS